MRLMLTGAGGFLGSRLLSFYGEKNEVWAPAHGGLDLTDGGAVSRGVRGFRPDAVVHCAAVSDVGACERNPALSLAVNVEGTKNLAAACGSGSPSDGPRLIFCSSDQVYFDGPGEEKTGMNQFAHCEKEILHPVPVYGQHKLLAERACRNLCPNSVILRLSWMYGELTQKERDEGRQNLGEIVRRMVREDVEWFFSDADYRGVTDAWEAVGYVEAAFSLPPGIYNFGSPNTLSLYETVRAVLRPLGKEKLARPAEGNRPRNLCMDPGKARAHGIRFRDTAQGLSDFLKAGI